MFKRTIATLIAAAALTSAGTASAHSTGASFSTSQQYHGFTLAAAHITAARYEQGYGHVGRCAWMNRRHAYCRVSQQPSPHLSIEWTDVITRLGRCTSHGVNMGNHCFTGSLKVQVVNRQEWYRA
jgi:hypothetical protein